MGEARSAAQRALAHEREMRLQQLAHGGWVDQVRDAARSTDAALEAAEQSIAELEAAARGLVLKPGQRLLDVNDLDAAVERAAEWLGGDTTWARSVLEAALTCSATDGEGGK